MWGFLQSWGIPQVNIVVSILSPGRMTWMIWGNPNLGNLHLRGCMYFLAGEFLPS
jgi:hypothetical protein